MQPSFFRDSDELLMHPDPRPIAALPPEDARSLMLDQLSQEEQSKAPDLDRVMGLGQLARLMRLEDFDSALVAWLGEHASPEGLDAVCLFVGGYWARGHEPLPSLVTHLLNGLRLHLPALLETLDRGNQLSCPVGLVDYLVLALCRGYSFSSNQDLRANIRSVLARVVPVTPYLQSATKISFEEVMGVRVAAAPPPFPPALCRASAFHEGLETYYLIEHRVTEEPVLRINSLMLDGTKLTVQYESLNPKLLDRWAKDLITQCLLVHFLQNSYGPRASLVVYKNEKTGSTSSGPYPRIGS